MTPAAGTMQLPASLTLREAHAVLEQLCAAVAAAAPESASNPTQAGVEFAVDASALAEFDTAALAVLLEGQRAARVRSLRMRIDAPPAKLAQLAALYGVDALLGLQTAQSAST
jgi:phospholipid transport system transporter-binding protein